MHTPSACTNLDIKTLKKDMKSKKYGRYILLYLYYEYGESFYQTQDLFRYYGRDINNELGSDFTLFTVYDKDTFEHWGEFVGTEVLKKQFIHEEQDVDSVDANNKYFNLMADLAESYRVLSLPALLVIDANSGVNASELVAKIEFTKKTKAEEIYRRIIVTIKAIKKYYGDFNRIADACNTKISVEYTTLEKKLTGSMNLYNLLYDYIDRSPYNQKSLADALGISERQVRRYMAGDSPLEYERVMAIAFLLKLSPKEVDKIFIAANLKPVLVEKERDDIIRKCLYSQMDLTSANEILTKKGCRPIEIKRTSKK